MLKKFFRFISSKFMSTTTVVEKNEDVVDLGATITVPEEMIVEKKRRTRKKKQDIDDQMSEVIN